MTRDPSHHALCFDLHTHTTASDGQLAPAELVRKALAIGLSALAVTDHDTMSGIEEALSEAAGHDLEVIPGVEISTDIASEEVHILGYYVDHQAPALRRQLALLRESRRERARKIVARLTQMGLALSWERTCEYAHGPSVGRPHIAQAMVQAGHVATVDEAFRRYIGRRGPAYVERFKLPTREAVQAILSAGGIPVLAHPLYATHHVPNLAAQGIAGLEVYYSGYTETDCEALNALASRFGLIATGGSDFHGESVLPGHDLGSVAIPAIVIEQLHAYRAALRSRLS